MSEEANKIKSLIRLAHDSITKHKREYSPSVHEIQAWIDNYLVDNA
jgi:hypothetical protein